MFNLSEVLLHNKCREKKLMTMCQVHSRTILIKKNISYTNFNQIFSRSKKINSLKEQLKKKT